MSRVSQCPIIIEDLRTLDIKFLNDNGYIKLNSCMASAMSWTRHGEIRASMNITCNMICEPPYVQLNYLLNDKPIEYRISLTPVTSNLGKGKVWYFICPKTKKRCRKLYLINGYFYHHSAYKCFYEFQTFSESNRNKCKEIKLYFNNEKAYDKIYSKGFKKFYKGKPTKKYLYYLNIIENAKDINYRELFE